MSPKVIALPEQVVDCEVIASVSGGKDSTALMLALKEAGIPYRAVFADTGWEAPETYAYLDTLRALVGPIDTVGIPGGMVARVRYRAGFPARMQRWCTRELKLEPLREFHDCVEAQSGRETVCVVGIRGAESARRAAMPMLEDEPAGYRSWGGWVWRPLLHWTIEDVLLIHHRHGVPVNPLYQAGHERVGCWPCIYARKEEIAMLPESRIAEIERLEAECTQLRADRNREQSGRYSHEQATFFQTQRNGLFGIRDVVLWATTSHGGRQLPLIPDPPRGGCMRWGLCEPPPDEDED